MTLVVARISGDDLFMVADSKLNDPTTIENNPLKSILKIAILHPLVKLAYAGIVHYAEQVIKDFYEQDISETEDFISLLMSAHIESNMQTDFIFATALAGIPQLFCIKEGNLEYSIENAWIGDHRAFDVYQRNFHTSQEMNLKTRMKNAMDSVSSCDFIDSVGWYTTLSLLDFQEHEHPIFLYNMETMAISGDRLTIQAGERAVIPYGQAETGSYSISTLFSRSLARPGLGRYFEQARLGILHCPRLSIYPILFRDCTGEEFVTRAFRENNVPLKGLILEQGTRIRFIDALELMDIEQQER